MIFVTGDTHGEIDITKLNSRLFPVGKLLAKQDYVIILGDFGLPWDGGASDRYWLQWLTAKPFTTLFIDGNHENFDLLLAYPVQLWSGGKARKITESVIHLGRGQVFTIDGMTLFTFGGAQSSDIERRQEGISWWKQEMPSEEDFDEGIKNLAKHNWAVDFILTHTGPTEIMIRMGKLRDPATGPTTLHQYLSRIASSATFSHWYFGHSHRDEQLTDRFTILYNTIVQLRLPRST